MRQTHGPSANADVIDLAEECRKNALFALDVLLRAYVPKNTSDWREGFAALELLRTDGFGKRSTSAATASGHEIPDAGAPAGTNEPAGQQTAQDAVANRGDARVASAGCANQLTDEAINNYSEFPNSDLIPAASLAEARRGYSWSGGAKVYCCYGMYCEAGHSPECKHAIPA